ncbi:MAG: hypothetical protein WBA07_26425 [Rivularia sp. (in: cyanobacteria)]
MGRKLPITNYQLPVTNYQSPITNPQLPITNPPILSVTKLLQVVKIEYLYSRQNWRSHL